MGDGVDGRWVGMTDWSTCPPPAKFADQLQAFWLALEPAARGAGVVWGCSAGAANQKPGKHLEYSHPRMQYVHDWISLQIAEQKIHPHLVANFDQVRTRHNTTVYTPQHNSGWILDQGNGHYNRKFKLISWLIAHHWDLKIWWPTAPSRGKQLTVLEVRGKQCWFCKLGGMIDECVDLCTHRVLCTVSSTM